MKKWYQNKKVWILTVEIDNHSGPDLMVNTETYDLTPFGTLSTGKYKLVKNDLEAEFELTEDK